MSISSALFSDSQSRVFRWLFGQPERSYHLNELRRLTGLGSASLQRELGKLAAAGLVRSEKVGNLRRFQVNTESPVYEELAGLTRKTLGAQPLLREALAPMKPKIELAFIYGSIAKGTDTAKSDIDIMLVGNGLLLSDVLKLLLPAESQLGRKINPTLYTPAEYRRRRAQKDSFLNRVLAQPVIPLIGATLGRGRAR
ncbi:MAG: nucleotidyltransferase domain-containing protein [Burkholderiales bacterium]|nr:nucleotidyltransferase domain-containing protein [Burkholderiales bacterium]